MRIATERLDLIAATPAMLRAEIHAPSTLGPLIGARVPATWPPDLYDRDAISWVLDRLQPGTIGWYTYYFVRRHDPLVIGAGGYKGPPSNGMVEIGYSVLAEHRRLGYASEATRGLMAHAFSNPEVERVIAHTLPDLHPSIRVLEKCGFRFVGPGDEEGAIQYETKKPAG